MLQSVLGAEQKILNEEPVGTSSLSLNALRVCKSDFRGRALVPCLGQIVIILISPVTGQIARARYAAKQRVKLIATYFNIGPLCSASLLGRPCTADIFNWSKLNFEFKIIWMDLDSVWAFMLITRP